MRFALAARRRRLRTMHIMADQGTYFFSRALSVELRIAGIECQEQVIYARYGELCMQFYCI